MQYHNISSDDQYIMSFMYKQKMVCRTIRNSLCNSTYDDEITHVTSGEISHNMLYNDYAYYFYSRDYVTNIRFVMCRICGEYKNKRKMNWLNFSLDSNTRMLCKCNGNLCLEDNTNYDMYISELDLEMAFLDIDETFLDIIDEFDENVYTNYCMLF